MRAPLVGRRVLVAEDNYLLAIAVKYALEQEGVVVVGPFPKVSTALAASEGVALDAAVLDACLADGSVQPLLLRLGARGIPLVLVTGLAEVESLSVPSSTPVLSKPVSPEKLVEVLHSLLV